MAAAVTPGVNATTFNAAGVSPDLLSSVGGGADAASRIQAFSFQNEFLTSMQRVTNPAEKLRRAQQLHAELAGDAGWVNPLSVEQISPAAEAARRAIPRNQRSAQRAAAAAFNDRRTAMLDSFQSEIDRARTLAAGGDNLSGYFPPALGTPVDLGNADNIGVVNDRLNMLRNHTMPQVIDRMEARKTADQATLSGQ